MKVTTSSPAQPILCVRPQSTAYLNAQLSRAGIRIKGISTAKMQEMPQLTQTNPTIQKTVIHPSTVVIVGTDITLSFTEGKLTQHLLYQLLVVNQPHL